jgi:cellobiose-specific phosphotransferase system component IIB
MKTQDILIVHPQTDEQLNAIKAFMKALKIKFEVTNMEIYNSDFVKKALESRIQAKEGKVTRIKKDNLEEFLGLDK